MKLGTDRARATFKSGAIRTDLKAGKSVETLAKQHGMTAAEVKRIARRGKQ